MDTTMDTTFKKYEEFGKKWIKGTVIEEIELNGKKFTFNEKQVEFLNSTKKYCLCSGGFGSGKTLGLLIKMILQSLCFPGNRLLLGRKHISDLERATLPELFELLPAKWYKHRVKDNIIRFANGSEIIMFGLDALQTGSQQDIKKAQQKLKSLNLGGYFIDQLEEIDEEVFKSLNSRLRRDVGIRQGNMTCNPANFWAYYFFKINAVKRDDVHLIESSMMDNKEHLPDDYIEDQLKNDDSYIKRFVYGQWSMDLLLKGTVFPQEFIDRMMLIERKPIAIEEECEIYEQPRSGVKYRMGVDPSEGVVDPSSISVVSEEGRKIAKYNGFIPIPAQIDKVHFLCQKYNKAFIVPEANAAGAALLEGIKDLPIFKRKVFEYREKRQMEKLGWKTSYQSKQALISHFKDLIRNRFPKIYDHNTNEELKTFVWSDSAKQKGAGAARGAHDDDVMSTLLAYWDLKPIDKRVLQLQQQIKHIRKSPFQYE